MEVPVVPERVPPLHSGGLSCDVATGHLLAGPDRGEGHQLQHPVLHHHRPRVGQAGVVSHGVERIEAHTDPSHSQLEAGGVRHEDARHLPDVLLAVVRQRTQLKNISQSWLRFNFSELHFV